MPLDRDDKDERGARLDLLLEEARRVRDRAADRLNGARAAMRRRLTQAKATLTAKRPSRKAR
jgi:hypothetical protein